jgi:hypothetical protein
LVEVLFSEIRKCQWQDLDLLVLTALSMPSSSWKKKRVLCDLGTNISKSYQSTEDNFDPTRPSCFIKSLLKGSFAELSDEANGAGNGAKIQGVGSQAHPLKIKLGTRSPIDLMNVFEPL